MAHLQWRPHEDENEQGNNMVGRQYRERIHPLEEFSCKKFRQRYRITKRQTEWLINDFYHHVDHQGRSQGGGVNLEDRFCLALRYFATGSNYSLVADYQGVSITMVSRCVRDVSDYFYRNSYRFILWPETLEEKVENALLFRENNTKPRVIGCIDGTHIAIRRPHLNAGAYVNRKGFHSLNTMLICDSQKIITHINPRWAGSVQDAYAWNCSSIRHESDAHLLDPYHLLGDSGYGCRRNLFTPVRDPITDQEIAYNEWHKETRSVVECTIGNLKQRWRCLDHHGGYLYHKPKRASKIIIACAALHNVAETGGVPLEPDLDNDHDAFRRIRNPRRLPRHRRVRDIQEIRRTAYIEALF